MGFSRQRLRGHRNGQRLSHAALGERAGLEPKVVAAFEAGEAEPSDDDVEALASALGVPATELEGRGLDEIDEYLDAVFQYAQPLTEDGVWRAAYALVETEEAARRLRERKGKRKGR